jgi:hypothetical protein
MERFQSVDHITFSYKYGSFLKLEEMMEFRERLHGSRVRSGGEDDAIDRHRVCAFCGDEISLAGRSRFTGERNLVG